MDIDVLAKNAQSLLAFKADLETLLPQLRKAVSDTVVIAGDVEEVKSLVLPALAKIETMKPDIEAVASDIAEIKGTLGPALAWIAEQQKAVEAAKVADAKNAVEVAKAHAEHADKAPAEKPAETHAADPAKPLEHVAEVEASLDAPAARSESETTTG